MTTCLGLISDVHATPAPLAEALAIFQQQQVDIILCPGDIAGYGNALDETVDLLMESQCKTILGNHEIWYLEKPEHAHTAIFRYLASLPRSLEFTLESKNLYMVHASPPDSYMEGIRLLDQDGKINPEQKQQWESRLAGFNHDVLIVGHTHQVFAEKLSGTLVVNPGSTTYNHSCAILSVPELTVDFYSLSNQRILKSWNWGTNQLPQDK
jgi:putative phosphoesterase